MLLVAAEPLEFKTLLNRLSGVTRIDCSLRFAASAEVHGDRWVLVADGPGPERAGAAADAAALRHKPDVIVSTGFCGALDPNLAVGEIVAADRIIGPGGEYPAQSPATSRPHASGALVSQDRVAVTVSDKRRLRETGACAVEMEASGLTPRASNWRSAFYCVRAVSDRADEDLPLDFNAMRDQSGRFDRGRIVRAAIARPWPRIPRLLRMRRNCIAAAGQLGEFLADCRF